MLRWNRVERLADVIVTGDLLHEEERTGVVATRGFFHVLLEAQEGRALGEENRESGQGDVGHRQMGVVTGAPIRQFGEDLAPVLHELIKAAPVHGAINAGTAPKVQVTIVLQLQRTDELIVLRSCSTPLRRLTPIKIRIAANAKSLQATRDARFSSASRFTLVGPAYLSSGH